MYRCRCTLPHDILDVVSWRENSDVEPAEALRLATKSVSERSNPEEEPPP